MERKVSRVESFRTSLKNQKQRLMAQKQVCIMYYSFIIEHFTSLVKENNVSFFFLLAPEQLWKTRNWRKTQREREERGTKGT